MRDYGRVKTVLSRAPIWFELRDRWPAAPPYTRRLSRPLALATYEPLSLGESVTINASDLIHGASQAGAHALAWYFGLLALLLALELTWFAFARHDRRFEFQKTWQPGQQALLGLGVALIVTALTCFASLAYAIGLPLAHGWSFPSGHACGAVVAYGMLAYILIRTLPRRWHLATVMAATALAFSVGWSRVFIEVHFASDVLAAFASGIAWLTLVVVVTELRLRGRHLSDGVR